MITLLLKVLVLICLTPFALFAVYLSYQFIYNCIEELIDKIKGNDKIKVEKDYFSPYKEELDNSTFFVIARHNETGNLLFTELVGGEWDRVIREDVVKRIDKLADENILKKVPQKFS